MKMLLLPIVFLLFLSVPAFATEGWCYQESADIATECGGLDTGSYGVDISTTTGYMYVNYSKPVLSSQESLWEISVTTNQIVNSGNYSIPEGCWNQGNTLQFRISSSTDSTGRNSGECYDGMTWQQFESFSWSGGYGNTGHAASEISPAYDGNWTTGTTCRQYQTGCNFVSISGEGNAEINEEAMRWFIEPPPPSASELFFENTTRPIVLLLVTIGLGLFVFRAMREGKMDVKTMIGMALTVMIGLAFVMAIGGM
jgi:hypothetical protein